MDKQPGYHDIPIGGVIARAGNAADYITGGWRTYRPQVDKTTCIECLQCWLLCPDMSILVKDEKMLGYDYDHCKGCGICAHVCPVKAIRMILDSNAPGDADELGCFYSKE